MTAVTGELEEVGKQLDERDAGHKAELHAQRKKRARDIHERESAHEADQTEKMEELRKKYEAELGDVREKAGELQQVLDFTLDKYEQEKSRELEQLREAVGKQEQQAKLLADIERENTELREQLGRSETQIKDALDQLENSIPRHSMLSVTSAGDSVSSASYGSNGVKRFRVLKILCACRSSEESVARLFGVVGKCMNGVRTYSIHTRAVVRTPFMRRT